jgi:hypothetical protein
MNSSPESAIAALRDDAGRATAQLWDRRARGTHAVSYAAALIGGDVATLSDALSITLAASPEATTLLDGMELRIRTLPTGVDTHPERCIYSVRGPILWSEPITARANALGNEDVFVCSHTSRSFDTVENRSSPQRSMRSRAPVVRCVARPARRCPRPRPSGSARSPTRRPVGAPTRDWPTCAAAA